MKKTIYVIGTAATAALVMACASDDGGSPDPVSGNGGDGDGSGGVVTGDGDAATGGTTAGTGGTTGDGDGDGPTTSTFVSGGLGEAGTWKGYLWTAAETGSDIMPAEITGNEACVSGTLGAAYEEWAMLGWNIAQEIDPETFEGGAVNAIAPGGSGVSVTVQNNGGSGLRVQIQTDETGTDSYCADVPAGGSGTIPWSSFVKECWPGGAMAPAYDGTTPIAQVAVQTYAASDMVPTTFDYCVIDLGPAM